MINNTDKAIYGFSEEIANGMPQNQLHSSPVHCKLVTTTFTVVPIQKYSRTWLPCSPSANKIYCWVNGAEYLAFLSTYVYLAILLPFYPTLNSNYHMCKLPMIWLSSPDKHILKEPLQLIIYMDGSSKIIKYCNLSAIAAIAELLQT